MLIIHRETPKDRLIVLGQGTREVQHMGRLIYPPGATEPIEVEDEVPAAVVEPEAEPEPEPAPEPVVEEVVELVNDGAEEEHVEQKAKGRRKKKE